MKGHGVPYSGAQDGEVALALSVWVSGTTWSVSASCCAGVTCDFTVWGEVHVPLGKHFVFYLEDMDGDIKHFLFSFVLFCPF